METIIKVICCIVLTTNSKKENYYSIVKDDRYICFYEIHKSEAFYIKNTLHLPIDTQYVESKTISIKVK
jgi:hypothetical protein